MQATCKSRILHDLHNKLIPSIMFLSIVISNVVVCLTILVYWNNCNNIHTYTYKYRHASNGGLISLYGESAYPSRVRLQAPFRGNINQLQEDGRFESRGCALLNNVRTCLCKYKRSVLFNIDPPFLEEYLMSYSALISKFSIYFAL